ncbi:hypothetical protein L6164_017779 [Bauhinia variegata]|uniref:Uncharacterized protein n=1 Tax=Bauhinia variegata TaxID=167791 RepID=A0ACB9N907_BAUVA|nr:hypothetical protein L6164_017779 [Bauhinia variegata]
MDALQSPLQSAPSQPLDQSNKGNCNTSASLDEPYKTQHFGCSSLKTCWDDIAGVPVLPGLTKSYAITPACLKLTYEDIWIRSSNGFASMLGSSSFSPTTRKKKVIFPHSLSSKKSTQNAAFCTVHQVSLQWLGRG